MVAQCAMRTTIECAMRFQQQWERACFGVIEPPRCLKCVSSFELTDYITFTESEIQLLAYLQIIDN